MATLPLVATLLWAVAPASASTWKATACQEGCIAAHDSRVVGCKTVKSREGPACVKRADAQKRACVAACDRKHPEKPAPKPSASGAKPAPAQPAAPSSQPQPQPSNGPGKL